MIAIRQNPALPLVVGALIALGACTSPAPSGLKTDYDAARDALEAGDTTNAITRYERLIAEYGSSDYGVTFAIEYAHALRQAGQPDRAIAIARQAEARAHGPQLGRARMIAALAAADLADAAVSTGAPRSEADAAIRSAFQALGETVRQHPEADPQGVMLVRMRTLREDMAVLELDALNETRQAGNTARAQAHARYILDNYGDTDAVLAAHQSLKTAIEVY